MKTLSCLFAIVLGLVGCSSSGVSGSPGVPEPVKVLENPETGHRVRLFKEIDFKVPATYDEEKHIAKWTEKNRKLGFTRETTPEMTASDWLHSESRNPGTISVIVNLDGTLAHVSIFRQRTFMATMYSIQKQRNRVSPVVAALIFVFSTSNAVLAEGDSVSNRLSFARDIVPVLTKAGCNSGACHGSLQGRGGFALSLLGYDVKGDFESLFLQARGRRVMPSVASESLFLLKASGQVPHGGGTRIQQESDSFHLLTRFVEQGMRPTQPDDPKIVRLTVKPESLVLSPEQQHGLRAMAEWDDGVQRDVTRWALFDSLDPQTADVTPDGVITAGRRGKSPVTVRFLGQVAAVDVVVPFESTPKLDGFKPVNFIDEFALTEWKRVGVEPAGQSSDSEFVRRVYLDLIGTLPTPDEARSFFASTDANKRSKLIDQLLERPEFVDYWSLKWSDLLRIDRRYVGDKGLDSFHGWVRRQVRENSPLDEFSRDVITAEGDLGSNGPVGYYFIDSKPEELAETTAQVFLGVRLQCARCHHHPLEVWSQDDYYGLAAFFTNLEFKDSGKFGVRFGGPKSVRASMTPNRDRKLQVLSAPRLLGGEEIDGQSLSDIRRPLADWITSRDNPFFARNLVNRYWAWLFGRGLVDPVDDMRATNPPSVPALFDALAQNFVKNDFDPKELLRTICRSQVYQRASRLNAERDRDGSLFTHRVPKRMPAEVLLDATCQFIGGTVNFNGQPPGTRAIALPDTAIGSRFLTTFGRPLRNSACDCSRVSKPDLAQALHMANDYWVNTSIASDSGRLAGLLKQKLSDDELLDELYLTSFTRLPTDEERQTVHELLQDIPNRTEGWQDVMWTLLNSTEFAFNH